MKAQPASEVVRSTVSVHPSLASTTMGISVIIQQLNSHGFILLRTPDGMLQSLSKSVQHTRHCGSDIFGETRDCSNNHADISLANFQRCSKIITVG